MEGLVSTERVVSMVSIERVVFIKGGGIHGESGIYVGFGIHGGGCIYRGVGDYGEVGIYGKVGNYGEGGIYGRGWYL